MQAQVSDHWQVGETLLNLYRVIERLGEREPSATYHVSHRLWHQSLAMKVLPRQQQTEAELQNFRQRCKGWLKLGLHPHIASFYYVRQWQGQLLLFSEYVAAGSLQTWIQTGRLARNSDAMRGSAPIALKQILDLAIQAAWGLDYLHQNRLVCGRLKPQNLLITGSGILKLTDLHHSTNLRPVDDLRAWAKLILGLAPQLDWWPTSLRDLFQSCEAQRPPTLQQCAHRLIEYYHDHFHSPYGRQAPMPQQWQADSLNNQAVALIDLNRPEEAVRLWQKAKQLQPQHPAATYNHDLWRWRSRQITNEQLLADLATLPPSAADLVAFLQLERNDPQAALQAFATYRHHSPQLSAPQQAAFALAQEVQSHTTTPEGKTLDAVAPTVLDYSPDGQYALWGSPDGSMMLWECRTHQGHRLAGHPGERIALIAFSPDQCYLITIASHPTTQEQALKLWSRMTGKCLATFPQLQTWEGLEQGPIQQRWSAEGRYFLRQTEVTLRLMEVATGDCLFICHRDGTPLLRTPQGQYGVTASAQPRLWDLHREVCLTSFAAPQGVTAVAMHPDGRRCLTGNGAGELTVWSLQGKVLNRLQVAPTLIHSLSVSRDGQLCLVGSQTVELWSLETGQWLRSLTRNPSQRAVLNPDGSQALVSGEQLTLWHIHQQQVTYQAPFHLCIAQSLAAERSVAQEYHQGIAQAEKALGQERWLEAWQALQGVRSLPGYREDHHAFALWTQLYTKLPHQNLQHTWELQSFTAHVGSIHTAEFTPDGQAFTGSRDGTIKRWHITPERTLGQVVGNPRGYLDSCSIHPQGQTVITSSRKSGLQQWDVATGQLLQTLSTPQFHCVRLAQSPDGHYLIGGTAQGELYLWELSTGQMLRHWQAHGAAINALCFSPDSLYCVSAGASNSWKRWEIATGVCVQTVTTPQSTLTSLAYSPDGHYLVTTSQDQTLIVWSVTLGRRLHTLRGHQGTITAACFSRDSHHLLSGSTDQTAKLWNVLTGDCAATLAVRGTAVTGVALSPDSRYALTVTENGYGKLWALDWQLAEQPGEGWDEGARPYLETFLNRQTPYRAEPALDRPVISWQQRWQDFPWGFVGLWWGLVWAGTAAALEIFGGIWTTPQAYLLAVGMAIALLGYFGGRQIGNPTIQLGSLFGAGVLTLVGVVDATVRWSSLAAVVWGAIATLMISGALWAFSPMTAVSTPPGLKVCQALRRYWGTWGGVGILALTTGAGITMELLIGAFNVPVVGIAGVTVAIIAVSQLWQLIRTGVRPQSLVQGLCLLLLLGLTAYKWAVPSYLGVLPMELCTDAPATRAYLARGGSPNAQFAHDDHLPLVQCAFQAEQPEIVAELLAAGADVNQGDAAGNTLLMEAVRQGQGEFVAELLRRGAEVNLRNRNQWTPLHLVEDLAIAEQLLAAGAEVNALAPNVGTPLHWAIASNQPQLFQLLLDHGGDINAYCAACEAPTPLHATILHDRIPMLTQLLAADADLTQVDGNDQTPLEFAQRQNRAKAVQLIEQALRGRES